MLLYRYLSTPVCLCGSDSQPAININAVSGHVGGCGIGSEESDKSSNFLWLSKPLERDARKNGFFIEIFSHIGFDETWADRIYADSSASELLGESFGQSDDTPLGSSIVGLARITLP